MQRTIKPEFSGKPEDLDSFVNMILDDMTDAQLAYYVYSKYADKETETASGYILPPSAVGGYDGLGGVSTDFPMPVHVGQSWDQELSRQVGEVKGNEMRGKHKLSSPNPLIFTAMTDLRINPLCGRLYESYAEDPYLTSQLADSEAKGAKGEDDFYMKAQVVTKHFSSYAAEWDRATKTNFLSNRSFREYYLSAVLSVLKNDNIQGVMTAFGAINGVPYTFSPYLKALKENQKYSLFSISDFIGDYDSLTGLGNGYDATYAKTAEQVAAMLTKVGSFSNNDSADKITVDDTLAALDKGLFNINRDDLKEQIRSQVELWVRTGYFNQSEYPYADLCADRNPVDATVKEHQSVAFQAAYSGMVLLKNQNNILPLDATKRYMVTGILSDFNIKPWYSIPTPENVVYAGLTPVDALHNYMSDKTGGITIAKNIVGKHIRIKSVETGKYLTANTDNYITANEENVDKATIFQVYDWGQQGYTFVDPKTNKFLYHNFAPAEFSMMDLSENQAPSIFSWETDDAGHAMFRWGSIPSEPIGVVESGYPFYEFYNHSGNYVAVDSTGKVVVGAEKGQAVSTESYFAVEVVAQAGEGAEVYAVDNDYAVVVVGTDSFVNASEMTDRKNLALGEGQIELVNKVAQEFPEKTVVVIRTNFPVAVQDIQDNPNVAAVLYTCYAGEYEGYALAQVLFGEAAPSGRLTFSWLKNLSSLPVLINKAGVDDAYSVYMKNADPEQLKLTYQYNNSEDVLYPFGYGLSYTNFTYSDIMVSTQSEEGQNLQIELTVTNSGTCNSGRDVIQVYAHSHNSAYGKYVPNKQLVGFAKTKELKPGESQVVEITIDPVNLRKWDVVSQSYIVEAGIYDIYIGTSVEHNIWVGERTLFGETISTLSLSEERNIWDYSYANTGVTGIEVSKERTAALAGGYFAVMSNHAGDYVILPRVETGEASALEVKVAGINESNEIDIYIDSIQGEPICTIQFEPTSPITYYLDEAETIEVNELGYTTITAELQSRVDTPSDICLVFRQSGIRIDSIKAI